jgi:hypothetical protein
VYSYFNSICTQKVFITLAEKDIAYETQNVDLFKNEKFTPQYLKINPKGVVGHRRDRSVNATPYDAQLCFGSVGYSREAGREKRTLLRAISSQPSRAIEIGRSSAIIRFMSEAQKWITWRPNSR